MNYVQTTILLMIFLSTPIQAWSETFEITSDTITLDNIQTSEKCLGNPSALDTKDSKIFKTTCTSTFTFAKDDFEDSPEPIIETIELQSNRAVCNYSLYGVQLFQKSNLDDGKNQGSKRLTLRITDALDGLNYTATSEAIMPILKNYKGQLILGLESMAGHRRLECQF